jgi:hypothetical protein
VLVPIAALPLSRLRVDLPQPVSGARLGLDAQLNHEGSGLVGQPLDQVQGHVNPDPRDMGASAETRPEETLACPGLAEADC